MPRPSTFSEDDATKIATLETKFGGLNDEVKRIHSRIDGITVEIGNVSDSLAHEFRSGLEKLGKSVAEGRSTKWPVLIAGAGFCLSFVVAVGTLAFIPVNSSINELKANIVPRTEFEILQTWTRRIDSDRRQDDRDEKARLLRENEELRRRKEP